jgi:hypothetical protein
MSLRAAPPPEDRNFNDAAIAASTVGSYDPVHGPAAPVR